MDLTTAILMIATPLFVILAFVCGVLMARRQPSLPTPKLDIGVPLAVEVERLRGGRREACRRELVPTRITNSPEGTFVEMQDRQSYERGRRIP